MTTKEVSEMVAEIGLPYAYYEFPDGTELAPPFVAFLFTDNNDFQADNINYVDIRELVIELYTKDKDLTLENKVREVLNTHELPFDQESEYLTDERCWITIFTTEVIING